MNLTNEYIENIRKTAKAYDSATDGTERAALGSRLDDMASQLSDGQIKQVRKIIMR